MGFLQTILALLNHFPLFALILQFFSPGRLPGKTKFYHTLFFFLSEFNSISFFLFFSFLSFSFLNFRFLSQGGLKIEELNITSFPEPKESWFTRLRKQMKTIFPKKKSSANPIVLPPKNFQMYPKSSFRKGHSRGIFIFIFIYSLS